MAAQEGQCVRRSPGPGHPRFQGNPDLCGRKWARSICKSRIDRKYDRNSIRSTRYKSQVVCHDTNLLFAEAPEAYKNVEQVMEALQEYGLVDVIATLRPLITFKG